MNPVVWSDRALDQLADVYVAADPADRAALVASAEWVNRELGDQPGEQGESRGGPWRVGFFNRLTVYFRPPRDRYGPVRVVSVHCPTRRRR